MVRNNTYSRDSIVDEFINGKTGRSYAYGRMYTRESPDGDGIQLVAYGQNIVAEKEGDSLTFHTGHHGQFSKSVTGYVKRFGSVLSRGNYEVDVTVTNESPQTSYEHRSIMAQSAQYISNYVGDFTEHLSDVEQEAVEDVEDALLQVLRLEFDE